MLLDDLMDVSRRRVLPLRRLTEHAIQQFYRDGFLVVRNVFGRDELQLMAQAMNRLRSVAHRLGVSQDYQGTQFVLGQPGGVQANSGAVQIQRVVWAAACEPVLSRFGKDPRLLSLASQVLGSRELDQLINQVHFKEPGDGVAFEWHQEH